MVESDYCMFYVRLYLITSLAPNACMLGASSSRNGTSHT